MDSAHKFTDMVKEFQTSSLIELFDSFGESTLYRLPTATKAWCIWRDNDCSFILAQLSSRISHALNALVSSEQVRF